MLARFPSDAVATRPAVIAARDARPLHSEASLFKGVFGGAGENYLPLRRVYVVDREPEGST